MNTGISSFEYVLSGVFLAGFSKINVFYDDDMSDIIYIFIYISDFLNKSFNPKLDPDSKKNGWRLP